MNSDPFGAIPGKEILQALENMGALDDIRPQLAKNYEGVMRQLEKIPSQVIYELLDVAYTPPEVFVHCAQTVAEVVDKIIGKSGKKRLPLMSRLESKLHTAIQQDMISSESLHLCASYLQAFCKKYPPRKTKDSISPEDDDIMYQDPYVILDGEDTIMLGNDSRKVGSEEIKTLFLIAEVMIHYTQVLRVLTLHEGVESETREKCLENEYERLEYIKKIKKELIKIFSWGKSRTPYMSLCVEGGPLRGDAGEYTIRDAVQELNRICGQFSREK